MRNQCRPLVSWVIPAFNAERTLEECAESVRSQSYQDWEALIVDDGSTDGTLKIAQRYAVFDSRFRILAQENKKQAAARNLAIDQARGEYIALLDADDIAHPQRLSLQMEFFFKAEDVTVLGGWRDNIALQDGRGLGITRHAASHQELCRNIFTNCPFSTSTVTARSWYFKIFRFDPNMTPCEDHDLWLRTYRIPCVRFSNLQFPIVTYRAKRYMPWSHYIKISRMYYYAAKAEGCKLFPLWRTARPLLGALRRNPLNRKR